MPYKNETTAKQYQKEYKRRVRQTSQTDNVQPFYPVQPQDGLDGWHQDACGRWFVYQQSYGTGLVRNYHGGGPMFHYLEAPTRTLASYAEPWEKVKAYVSGGNLDNLQRIAGSLGKYADEVWFGDLSMGEIGRVIGVMAASFTR